MSEIVNSNDLPEVGEVEAAKAVDGSPKKDNVLGKRSANEDNSPAAPARKTRRNSKKSEEPPENTQEQEAPDAPKDKEVEEPPKAETGTQEKAPIADAIADAPIADADAPFADAPSADADGNGEKQDADVSVVEDSQDSAATEDKLNERIEPGADGDSQTVGSETQ